MPGPARSLDHFVLFARDLRCGAAAYERMGFRVQPLMEHLVIGTSNTIVQFRDTYLELIGDFEGCRNESLLDRAAERREHGDGYYMTSCTSSQLETDRALLQDLGLEPDPIVSARRRVRLPYSGWDETDSRSMYVWNRTRTLMSFFISDHRKPEVTWIPEYQIHPNTTERVTRLTYVAADPQQDVAYLAAMLGFEPRTSTSQFVEFQTPRGEILELLSPALCARRFGRLAPEWIPALGGYGVAIALRVGDLDRCRWALRDGGVPCELESDGIRVGAHHACGVILEFRA